MASSSSNANTILDGTILQITSHIFNGTNYLFWSQPVMMFIRGNGKEDYLSDEISVPAITDQNYKNWKAVNCMIMSWLINSMTPEIGEIFLFYSTAKEIWDAVREMYFDSENTFELFGIERKLYELRQGDMLVTQYFAQLSRLWQHLDMFENHKWGCASDSSMYKKIVEKERVFKFLLGLNRELDEVRCRILATKPLPNVREAFAEVKREESWKQLMLLRAGTNSESEGSALIARNSYCHENCCNGNQSYYGNENRTWKSRPWCEHCKKLGHVKKVCWDIHGKPLDWKSNKGASNRRGKALQASIPFEGSELEEDDWPC